MSIPKFDKKGNIPVGNLFDQTGGRCTPLIHATLSDLHTRFVSDFPRSRTRPKIWDGWMRHRTELEQTTIRFATLVNGGFVTSSLDPKDVDLCIIAEAADLNALAGSDLTKFKEFERLTDTQQTKGPYLCDTYPIRLYPVQNLRFHLTARDWNYWTRVFGSDRKGNPKAFFIVTQSGVL